MWQEGGRCGRREGGVAGGSGVWQDNISIPGLICHHGVETRLLLWLSFQPDLYLAGTAKPSLEDR